MNRIIIYSVIVLSLLIISCKPENRIDICDNWKIKTGDCNDYSLNGFDDSGWDEISLPAIPVKEKKRQVIWLRKTFFVPTDYKGKELAVEIGKIWDSDQTFMNGIKIGSSGSGFPDFFSYWNYNRYYIIPENAIRYGENNLISIRIFSNCLSFYDGSPFISSLRSVRTYNFFRRLAAEYIVIGLTLISIFFGIISMVQYISYRKFKIPLYYSICSLLIGLMSVEFYIPDIRFISYITKDNIYYSIMTLVIWSYYFLLENMLNTRSRIFRVIVTAAMLVAVTVSLTATADDPVQGWRIVIIASLTFLAYVFCGVLLLKRFINRKATKEVVILAAAYIINMAGVFHDIFMMEGLISPDTFLIPLAYYFLYVCFGMVLSLQFSRIQAEKIMAEKFREQYINEITLAKKIQDQLIPSVPPAGYISSLYKPLEDVGGDFYDFIHFDNSENIGIFISDVSGHGLPAAFITSMIKMIILQSGSRKDNPAELLKYINDVLQNKTADNFITAIYGIYNPVSRTFRYANAGHPQPNIITPESITQLKKGNNTALAIFSNTVLAEYNKEYTNFEVELPINSKLLLFTDGLAETRPHNKSGLTFENTYMSEFFSNNNELNCDRFIEKLYLRLVEYRGSESFEDDICLVCIDAGEIKQNNS